MKEFWSDGEDMGDGQTTRGPARRVRRAGAAAGAGPKRQRGPNGLGPSKLRHQIVTHYNTVTRRHAAPKMILELGIPSSRRPYHTQTAWDMKEEVVGAGLHIFWAQQWL